MQWAALIRLLLKRIAVNIIISEIGGKSASNVHLCVRIWCLISLAMCRKASVLSSDMPLLDRRMKEMNILLYYFDFALFTMRFRVAQRQPHFRLLVSWLNFIALSVRALSLTRKRINPTKEDSSLPLKSQVKLLITNNAFCIVQRATAQSKTGIFRD
jgi:hypothetical protein